ncbi:MAG: hypothetical protein JSV04_09600 [Candidatus Heimdallarchaeota archaeon]|nr:MAG: hypothetical protein JSV04_09600 [Candidatus Heimdallarchaeota archaeon]
MEAFTISKQDDHKARYKAFGKKLRKIQDETDEEVQEKLVKGLEAVSTTSFLPEDLASYLLSLKREMKLPVSILPSSLFKRPVFHGKEEFFHRLASELISFGIAYQRVYLRRIRLSQLATLFHKHRPWWQCDIQDIERAMDILSQNDIVQESPEGFLFEPMTMSTDIKEFLSLIANEINEFGEITLSTIQERVTWNSSKIETILDLLSSNQVCILDKKKGLVFFPELK